MSNKRNLMTFERQIKLRQWLIDNASYICKQELRMADCASEAEKALGFPVTQGNLGTIIDTIEGVQWPWLGRKGWEANANAKKDLEQLKEAVGKLVEDFAGMQASLDSRAGLTSSVVASLDRQSLAITDLNTKVAVLDSEYKSLAEQVKDLRKTVMQMNTNLERCLTQLGFKQVNAAVSAAAAAAVQDAVKK